METENNRQNKRLELLESNSKQLSVLATSTEKLALSMESMAKEQEAQGKRLETLERRDGVEKLSVNVERLIEDYTQYDERLKALEGRDGDKWRTVVSHVITAIAGAVVYYMLAKIGM